MPILNNVTITGTKSRQQRDVLVDTGASRSFVRRDLAEVLGVLTPLDPPLKFTLANSAEVQFTHSIELILSTEPNLVVSDAFIVMDDPVADVILGEKTIKDHKLTIDYKHGAIYALLTHTTEKKPALSPITERKETPMNAQLKLLMAQLGLTMAENMTDDQAVAAIVAHKAPPSASSAVASEPVLALLGLPKEAKEPEVKGAILALQNPGNVVPIEQHNAVVQNLEKLERENFLAVARGEGKVTPAEMTAGQPLANLYRDDFATFEAFVAKRGKQVPLGVTPSKAPPAAALQSDDVQAAINAQLGLSNEVFAKYAQ